MNMRRLAMLAVVLGAGFFAPQTARADVGFSVHVNDGYYGRGYHGGYHGGYGYHDWRRGNYYAPSYNVYPAYPGYYVPPPVVYAPPPVVYAPPPRQTIIVTQPSPPPVVYAEPSIAADQSSPTYTNESGQTCREYQSTVTVGNVQQPSYGTACLQPDGSWRVVQ